MRRSLRHIVAGTYPPAIVAAVLPVLLAAPARAAVGNRRSAPVLHVRGTTRVEARALPLQVQETKEPAVELRGRLADDTRRPVPNAKVEVVWPEATGPRATRWTGCPGDARPRESPGSWQIATDDEGRFCMRLLGWTAMPGGATVGLRYRGDDNYDGVQASVTVNLTRRAALLGLSGLPPRWSLDRPSQNLQLQTSVEPPYLPGELADTLQLELYGQDLSEGSPGPARHLWRGSVVAGQGIRVQIPTAALGPPGPMDLTVTGSAPRHIEAERRTARVIKTAVVTLHHPPGPAIVSDSEHVRLAIEARAGRRPVTAGAVEVSVDGRSVATAPVVQGVARPTVALQRTTPEPRLLTVKYLPGAPWWLSGDELELTVALKPPSPWRQIPWVVAAALLALWMGRGWWPPRTARRHKPTRRGPQARGRPLLEVVEQSPGASSWTGVVIDAHDQFPLVGASLRVRSPSFVSDAATVFTVTDEQGGFRLDGADLHSAEGATLEVRAPSHAGLSRPLPPPGTLRIALISRRRALLDELVRWARRRGHPWWVPAEPTPAHVAHEAEAQQVPETAQWARAVQEAAFGPDAPTERTEHELAPPSRAPATAVGPGGRGGREMPPGAG